ncbi:MAG TPA: 50S ribosomal protein L31 [Candidatus Pacebacteria bacterium]|nr:50S ribosomal protein L31 [Candidatus Paceibacterota bacterium]
MKTGIHPQWHHDCVVTCGCGNTFVTGSISPTLKVDICGACHPFFTGEMKFVDRQGRVDRFVQKMKAAEQNKQVKALKAAKQLVNKGPAKSYQDILREQQNNLRRQAASFAKTSDSSPVAQAK